jgi:putative restriction endonuclease
MITVNGGLRIHLASSLADAVLTDAMTRHYYGQPPLREALLLPDGALAPNRKYLDWHRQKIFTA